MECLRHNRHERRWSLVTIALSVFVAALLTWMLIANQRQRRELLRLASRDPLTGLPNRRCTARLASAALKSASVTLRPVTITLIDLNHFKSIDDRYGREVGDYVLKEFARHAHARLGTSVTLGRWGRAVFMLILPDATLHAAVATLGQLRTMTGEIPLPDASCGPKVTFSVGLVSCNGPVKSLNEIVASAEAALDEARQGKLNLWRLDNKGCRGVTSGVLRPRYVKLDSETIATQKHRNRARTSIAAIPKWHQANQAFSGHRSCSNERAKSIIYSFS